MPGAAVPKVYQEFRDSWEQDRELHVAAYVTGKQSFVLNLLPEEAVRLTAGDVLDILRRRLGPAVDAALESVDADHMRHGLPEALQSPVAGQPDGSWLRRTNMVGINVRTIANFWNVIKYMLTVPAFQDSVHLLPIWEPGVVGSLYGMSSWQINTEFFSAELREACHHLDTVERQLAAVIHLLHAMGKAVGMDVIPHTDRFSEIALSHPDYFEWLQRQGTEIVDHADQLHTKVEDCIFRFLEAHGPAAAGQPIPPSAEALFSDTFPEDSRLRLLFGSPQDREGRSERRNQLVKHLNDYGYEPVPATMAPPYRGLKVDPDSLYVDSRGNTWYDYLITEPQPMSRVFNPLARYKLYSRLDDNQDWQIDFDRPRREVWQYVCEQYYQVQHRFGFDFMRGDMSHVQMRPGGVPQAIGEYYDILRAVKRHIQKERGVSYFGYFAETFLAPRNTMLYGDEADHLEASEADTTLGDLQSTSVGSSEFLQRLRQYHDLVTTRSFAPNFAVMTGDKDDPRFDGFYLTGKGLRLFLALFLTDMPSYMALGFETRDVHHRPAPNEYYTKLYVFQEAVGPKATSGPYRWGKNGALFHRVTGLRLYADTISPTIRGKPTRWLIAPDSTGVHKHIAWTQQDEKPAYILVANTDTEEGVEEFNIPRVAGVGQDAHLALDFTTASGTTHRDRVLTFSGQGYRVERLAASEGRVYRVVCSQSR